MHEILHHIRKALIARLNGDVYLNGNTVPVYNRIPSRANYPLIRIYSVNNSEVDQNQQTFNLEASVRVEIITRYDGNSGGELDCNLVVDQILNKVRTRSSGYIDLTENGWNVYAILNDGVSYLEDDFEDYTYNRAIIDLTIRAEQIQIDGGLQSELQNELQS
jgi:hypothetical protein